MTPLEALRALGPGEEPPVEAKQRVAGALFTALDAAALAATSAPKPLAPASLHPAPVSLLGGVAGSKVLAVAAGIWLMGGVTGAALYRVLRPTDVRVVYVDRAARTAGSATLPPERASEPSLTAGNSAPSGAQSAPPTPNAARIRPSSVADSPSDLARERALLDIARADAAHGDPTQALNTAEQHRHQFPRGRLAEEREALAIRALLSLGRRQEAEARARAFRGAYPHSFLIPALESALSGP
jgi:hypothetical protein